ncbi:MAG: hypothetical protein JW769_05460 [Parachlamydiales bacterium]|nr:hypothetical protein [Parachlamydiales bacterium]
MFRIFFVLFPVVTYAVYVGNPIQPSVYSDGIFCSKGNWSLRGGFLHETIYRGRYEDKFDPVNNNSLNTKLQADTGLIFLNYHQRIDLYAMIGGSKLEVDDTIFTERNVSYCGGLKAVLFDFSNFRFGVDGKYFRSKNRTDYLLIDKEIYTIITKDYSYVYSEWQGSLGVSYLMLPFIPYGGLTYLYSEITPEPQVGLLQTPSGSIEKFQDSVSRTKRNWGMMLGISFINKEKIGLNIETRFFDQNSVGISGEIKF